MERYCTPATISYFMKVYFVCETPSKNMIFFKKCRSKSNLDPNHFQIKAFPINHFENWYKWKVLVSKHYHYKIFVKCFVKGVKQWSLYDPIWPHRWRHSKKTKTAVFLKVIIFEGASVKRLKLYAFFSRVHYHFKNYVNKISWIFRKEKRK